MSSTKEFEQAAAAERKAARTMGLSGQVVTLAVALVFFVLYLVLNHTTGVRGFQVLAGVEGVSLMERIFAYGTSLGMLGTVITLATRRTYVGWISWMFVGFSFFVALWALWALGSESGAGIGFFCGVLADLVAFIGFSRVAMRKSPEQLAAQERMRAAAGQLDPVAAVQEDIRATPVAEQNPLLIDDRRAQAAARYRRQHGAD